MERKIRPLGYLHCLAGFFIFSDSADNFWVQLAETGEYKVTQ
ncbi:hypothetical protein RCG23_09875 [Neobacillus sp. PS3-34]|nr:hypothetical protein [Neobacillus sp. PS3-34]WML50112.1 hypothetical protein RCG23_09875 [Neobacillus sp. PS3-34]